jgi:hypothetical protein
MANVIINPNPNGATLHKTIGPFASFRIKTFSYIGDRLFRRSFRFRLQDDPFPLGTDDARNEYCCSTFEPWAGLGLPPSLPGGLSLGAVLLSSAAHQGFRSVLMQRNGYFS